MIASRNGHGRHDVDDQSSPWPHNIEIEESVLACCVAGRTTDILASGIEESDFYIPSHGLIWRAIRNLLDVGSGVDLVTIRDELMRLGLHDEVGGAPALARLANAFQPSHWQTYVDRVLADSRSRRAMHAMREADRRLRLGDSYDAVLSDMQSAIEGAISESLRPNYISADQLIAENPDLREPVVDGLFRRGEIMNIIAAAKVGKSWLVLMLLLSIATGRAFLGVFKTFRARVLLIDNELHPPTIAKRIKAVAEAMGILSSEYADTLCIESMRGRGATLDKLAGYFRCIKPGDFVVIVIDAWYRAIPKGTDENSNADITALYNILDRYAKQTGAAFILIHHSSKGNQSEKSIVDVGAGASAQARASDAHLVIRSHEEDDAVVVEAVARSFPQPKPFGMRWNYPTWTVDESLDVTRLKRAGKPKREKSEVEEAAKPEPWTVERFVATCITGDPEPTASIVSKATVAGISERQARAFINQAETSALAFRWPRQGRGPERFATARFDELVNPNGGNNG